MSLKSTDMDKSSTVNCGYAVCVHYPACCKQISTCPHYKKEIDKLQFLRAIDKWDRLGSDGVRQLLTTGRRDESGDFTEGVGLSETQADLVLHFLKIKGETNEKTLYKIWVWFRVMTMPKGELDTLYDELKALGMIDD